MCGITHADVFDELVKEYNRRNELFPDSWYAKGHLRWLLEPLAYPERAMEDTKSIVVCARRYNKYVRYPNLEGRIGKVYVFDHRFAGAKAHSAPTAFEEFLKEMGIRAQRQIDFPGYPIVSARRSAFRAGLGRFGKNNFLYTEYGSWVWFDVWVTDRKMQYDEPKKNSTCPPDCTKCIDACPTKALIAPYTFDYSKCITYCSYHLCMPTSSPPIAPLSKLPPEDLRQQMGGWLYGCDVCQDACPMNRKWVEEEEFPGLRDVAQMVTLENIFLMDEEYFQNILLPR